MKQKFVPGLDFWPLKKKKFLFSHYWKQSLCASFNSFGSYRCSFMVENCFCLSSIFAQAPQKDNSTFFVSDVSFLSSFKKGIILSSSPQFTKDFCFLCKDKHKYSFIKKEMILSALYQVHHSFVSFILFLLMHPSSCFLERSFVIIIFCFLAPMNIPRANVIYGQDQTPNPEITECTLCHFFFV